MELTADRAGATWDDHRRLAFLLEAARQLGSTLDLERIYASLQALLSSALPLDGLIVSSFDTDTEIIRCEHVWSDGVVGDASAFPPLPWDRTGQGMQSGVILTRKAQMFDIAQKVRERKTTYLQVSPEGGSAPVVDEPASKTAMMAPIMLEGQVTGVVQAMSDKPNAYSPDDLAVFDGVVLQMAAAWHHARLYREMERRVEKRTAELQDAVKELEGFTYTVSHDLRGPLRAISAASMILREDFGDQLPEDAHQHLQRQADAAKRMGALIDDLLKLSRLGRQELTPAEFDMSALGVDVAEELGIQARVVVQPQMEAWGDARLIKFVMLNLLENSAKFSEGKSPIRVGFDGGEFFVADAGIGFDMEYVDKVFRPFERLVRNDEYPGTGIGLANVQRIIHRHGGKVRAESEVGKGATFFFSLPKT